MVVMPASDTAAHCTMAGVPSVVVDVALPSSTDPPTSKTGEADAERKKNTRSARFRSQLRKTELCRHKLNGKCRAGQACPFAHGEQELQTRPNLSKTSLCKAWIDGNCPNEAAHCAFAHGAWELRTTQAFAKSSAKDNSQAQVGRHASEGATPAHRGADESVPGPLPLHPNSSNSSRDMEFETMRAGGASQGLRMSCADTVSEAYKRYGHSPSSGSVRGAIGKGGWEPVSQRSTMPPDSDQDTDIPQGVPSSFAGTPAAGQRVVVLEMAAHVGEGPAPCTPRPQSSPMDHLISADLAGSPFWVEVPPLVLLPCIAPVPVVSSLYAQDMAASHHGEHQKRMLREEIAALLRNAMPSHYED